MQAQVANPHRKGPPDATGLAAAQAAQDAARPAVVILFGSRARGDWREHSDIDLLVITEEEDTRVAQGAAHWGDPSLGGAAPLRSPSGHHTHDPPAV